MSAHVARFVERAIEQGILVRPDLVRGSRVREAKGSARSRIAVP
jgi:hypothetical protein